MRPFTRSVLLCLALCPSLSLQAAPVQGLYRVVEPLPAEQDDAREEGLRRAFDTLVLRLTGRPEAAQSEALAPLRKDPQPVVRQFGFQGERVVVEFEPAAVQRHLQEAGIRTWGVDRPEILAWWLVEGPAGAQLIGDDQPGAVALREAAQHRGLPLVVPLADLAEQLAVTADTLGQPARLAEPSARYNADALLAVRAREDAGRWQADWRLLLGDQQTRGEAAGETPEALADAVMREAHLWLAARFASRPGNAEALVLEIDNVDVSRFAETERLMQSLQAQLVGLEGTRLIYRLKADPAQVRAQLGLSELSEVPVEDAMAAEQAPIDAAAQPTAPAAQPSAPAEPGLRLRYRW